jgi:HEAT repeat protein
MRALGRRGPGIVPKRFKPLLNERDGNLWPSFCTWVEHASAGDLVAAYEASRNPWARHWMCYRVGRRGLHAALPMLVHALNDPDSDVRTEAADALYALEDPRSGYDLFKCYAVEDNPGVRTTLLLALGRTRYAPALPALIGALAEADPHIRYCAARGLGAMGDKSALPALWEAYTEEPEHPESKHSYYSNKETMRRIIDELEVG